MKIERKIVICELKEILILSGVGVLFNLFLYEVNASNLTLSILIWLALAKGNGYIVDVLNRQISWLHQPVTRVVIGMVAMVVYTVLAFGVIVIGVRWAFDGVSPMEMLRRIEPGDFTVAILITLIISMFIHGRAFYLNWKHALLREEKLKNESLRSQYESLKNQVNPHFLFNSLNVLSSLVYDDQQKAVAFIRKMSDVYRYVLDKKDQELVPLDEELNFLKSYVYLQQIRFGNNFQIEITEEGNGYVPPLALQLLVENAIKHNTVSEARPLHVQVQITEDRIMIKNNVQEKLSKDSTGIGLNNLRARYQYLTERPVEILSDPKEFKVSLPLLQVKNELHHSGRREDSKQ